MGTHGDPTDFSTFEAEQVDGKAPGVAGPFVGVFALGVPRRAPNGRKRHGVVRLRAGREGCFYIYIYMCVCVKYVYIYVINI